MDLTFLGYGGGMARFNSLREWASFWNPNYAPALFSIYIDRCLRAIIQPVLKTTVLFVGMILFIVFIVDLIYSGNIWFKYQPSNQIPTDARQASVIAGLDGAEVSASGWGSGGPRFQSHPRLTFQSCSRQIIDFTSLYLIYLNIFGNIIAMANHLFVYFLKTCSGFDISRSLNDFLQMVTWIRNTIQPKSVAGG